MGNIFKVFDVEYNFSDEKNARVSCIGWFLQHFKNKYWEPETFKVFNRVRNKDTVALDIGAWIGPTTIWLSKNFKSVISVEPDAVAFAALSANIEKSQCDNVTLINKPVYSESVDILFGVNIHNRQLANEGLGASTSQIKESQTDNTDNILQAITLDYFKQLDNYNNISFVKVDIEGGEEAILESLFSTAETNKWQVYLSFHCDWWQDKDVERFRRCFEKAKSIITDMNVWNNKSVDDVINHIKANPFAAVYFEF
jgi:FkbM family methyltransferase